MFRCYLFYARDPALCILSRARTAVPLARRPTEISQREWPAEYKDPEPRVPPSHAPGGRGSMGFGTRGAVRPPRRRLMLGLWAAAAAFGPALVGALAQTDDPDAVPIRYGAT